MFQGIHIQSTGYSVFSIKDAVLVMVADCTMSVIGGHIIQWSIESIPFLCRSRSLLSSWIHGTQFRKRDKRCGSITWITSRIVPHFIQSIQLFLLHSLLIQKQSLICHGLEFGLCSSLWWYSFSEFLPCLVYLFPITLFIDSIDRTRRRIHYLYVWFGNLNIRLIFDLSFFQSPFFRAHHALTVIGTCIVCGILGLVFFCAQVDHLFHFLKGRILSEWISFLQSLQWLHWFFLSCGGHCIRDCGRRWSLWLVISKIKDQLHLFHVLVISSVIWNLNSVDQLRLSVKFLELKEQSSNC